MYSESDTDGKNLEKDVRSCQTMVHSKWNGYSKSDKLDGPLENDDKGNG